jgi:hypothetical protein
MAATNYPIAAYSGDKSGHRQFGHRSGYVDEPPGKGLDSRYSRTGTNI